MANVTLKNIRKVYDNEVVAVEDFNLEIADKEFVVLVGPSGCGKSTTLRMIAGLEDITSGELYIDERKINNTPPKDRDIAMVFQNYALYPHMSVYDNMAFSLQLRKIGKVEIKEKVNEAADILGITDLLERKPKALSGGQRQRVAIGRAIVRSPKVFLMDEPLSNLDAKLRNQMRAELIKLRHRIDTTFVYVTHDQVEAMTLGDRIVIMKDGFIQQVDTPQQVFDHPNNQFVAGFIGTPQMNFFPAVLKKSAGGYSVEAAGVTISLPKETQDSLFAHGYGDTEITLGIRPEHIGIAADDAPQAIGATVDVSEMMGSEVYFHVTVDGKDTIIRTPIRKLPESTQVGYGLSARISFILPGHLVHLFDRDSGDNLLKTASET
jgi:multiple sugar transport system ATP-binding protein